jgi:D-tyrosyl-tRNA(Tyr) deacylase
VQRVSRASVLADRETVGQIGRGLLLFLGVTHSDTASAAQRLCDKVVGLRIFEDQAGKMNLSVLDIGGEILCVSQFTLYSDIRRGRRPSFDAAAPPELAERLYTSLVPGGRARGCPLRDRQVRRAHGGDSFERWPGDHPRRLSRTGRAAPNLTAAGPRPQRSFTNHHKDTRPCG